MPVSFPFHAPISWRKGALLTRLRGCGEDARSIWCLAGPPSAASVQSWVKVSFSLNFVHFVMTALTGQRAGLHLESILVILRALSVHRSLRIMRAWQ